MIQFDHLSKEYDRIRAVNDLTTEIPTGEIFGMLVIGLVGGGVFHMFRKYKRR
jgi:ABC-type uncharacterized transport system ATPase subunit